MEPEYLKVATNVTQLREKGMDYCVLEENFYSFSIQG